MPSRSIRVAVLGARGLVGQWFLKMLHGHPWFKLTAVTSHEAVGLRYRDAVKWLAGGDVPFDFGEMEFIEADPKKVDADVVFSALPTEAARKLELMFAEAGFTVVSKSAAYRLDENVPLVVPEINPDHLALIDVQRTKMSGAIVTDPNCTTTILALPLKPIHDAYGIRKVVVTTLQAASGAGYPGVASLDLIDNVVPYIQGEEEKVRDELLKIMGKLSGGRVEWAGMEVASTCTRVPVLDGHLESVYVETEREVDENEVVELLQEFKGKPQTLKLPTAPEKPIIVLSGVDRPQPRLDRLSGSVPGMSVTVGRVRRGVNKRSVMFLALGHNLVRGAAGSAILLAELLAAEKYI
ncbi:MAG: aspartate-semialdehyde dehydrogenase [Thermofilaceae archaeon]|nr:aspartate-semialdehyde dehydrogenase [Thermofilaceae archaeon]MCX8179838.1 aspartate-semialdehyde dehydrogenase [Thermofilaceae archaeon]MDW8004364.1 aspartate-semialdehyde dehydrogenase [Thermofilaceae archaeon]